MTRTVRQGGRYLDSGLYGCLAVGLPFANAAKLRHPESRVLLITGDGSVGFNFMEFHTAIRKGLPIVVVIANDQSWGMIAHSQTLRLGHSIPDGTWLGRVEYHRLVEALGGFGAGGRAAGGDPSGPGGGLRLGQDGLHQRDGGSLRDQPRERRPGQSRRLLRRAIK